MKKSNSIGMAYISKFKDKQTGDEKKSLSVLIKEDALEELKANASKGFIRLRIFFNDRPKKTEKSPDASVYAARKPEENTPATPEKKEIKEESGGGMPW